MFYVEMLHFWKWWHCSFCWYFHCFIRSTHNYSFQKSNILWL